MILPSPTNFWEVQKFPLTWGLIFINFFIYFVFFGGVKEPSWANFFSDQNMALSGRVYHQYLETLDPVQKSQLPGWLQQLEPSEAFHYQTMGAWALRDSRFLDQSANLQVIGDEVAIKNWKESMHRFKNSYFDQLAFRLGLSEATKNSLSWVTYQFSHSSIVHLLSNMIYLLIIGCAVEAMVGSGGLVLLYLSGGFFAGIMFLFMKSHGATVPMIGASGSVSALLAFYVFFEQRRSIRYNYLISLHPQHFGTIYLPTLWMVPLFLLSDFSHQISSVEGLGSGVAYSAHIGGTVFGVAVALISRYVFKLRNGMLKPEQG